MDYAMVLKNTVIGVLQNQETEPHWGSDPDGNPVTATPCDDTVTLGMIYDPETNTFSEYIPPEPTPEPEPQPSQLDIIQAAVEKSNSELRQEGAEALTLELIEGGIL